MMLDKEVIIMYYSIDEFIRKHDKEDNVKKSHCRLFDTKYDERSCFGYLSTRSTSQII